MQIDRYTTVIKRLAKDKGFTQGELGDFLNKSPNATNKLLNRGMSVDDLITICDVLGLTIIIKDPDDGREYHLDV